MAVTKAVGLSSLSLLATMLGTGSFDQAAEAQSPPREHSIRLQYAYYKDWQSSDEDRMLVRTPQLLYTGPIAEDLALEAGVVFDSVSGASPLYHDSLTGASGKGIRDNRRAADLKLTKYWKDFSIGVGGSVSNEDDYDSVGGSTEVQFWNSNKSTVWSFGLAGHDDSVSSSSNPDLDESSTSFSYLAGVTQTIDRDSLLQVNLTYSSTDGYQSDPYKLADLRPESREEWAVLGRYIRNIESCGSALHLDYRYFMDTWGIDSHLFEVNLYRPITDSFMLRPLLRYYTQDKADFYSSRFPPGPTKDGFYSADQRLSAFGELGAGLGFIYDWGHSWVTDLSFEYNQQRGSLRGFGQGSSDIKNFYELLVSFGIEKKF